jgi:hypothetical protein
MASSDFIRLIVYGRAAASALEFALVQGKAIRQQVSMRLRSAEAAPERHPAILANRGSNEKHLSTRILPPLPVARRPDRA